MQKVAQKIQRQEQILLSLKRLDYLTREQIQTLHNLGGQRNASRILKDMDQYVSSFRDGQNIYYLNQEGRELVNSTKVRKKTIQARHYIMRNDIYIAFNRPLTWKNEVKIGVKELNLSNIADAIFTKDGRYYIVEVDHTQKMAKNRTKIERYKRIINANVFPSPPKFIWITVTEYRRKQLEKLCNDLDYQIFTVTDFH